MKKNLLLFIFIILIYTLTSNILEKTNILPANALRMRVIGNSNSSYDQYVKTKVKEEVEEELFKLLKNENNVDNARNKIKNSIPLIEKRVGKILIKENYPLGYQINYGKNYFPEKVYKGVTYDEGYYESLVITLGEGKGDNFWCVMFPPLCMMETDSLDDIEYKSLIKELISKYLKSH